MAMSAATCGGIARIKLLAVVAVKASNRVYGARAHFQNGVRLHRFALVWESGVGDRVFDQVRPRRRRRAATGRRAATPRCPPPGRLMIGASGPRPGGAAHHDRQFDRHWRGCGSAVNRSDVGWPATRWSMTRVRLGVDWGDECSRATVFDAFVEQPKWYPLGNRWAHSLLGLAEHRYPRRSGQLITWAFPHWSAHRHVRLAAPSGSNQFRYVFCVAVTRAKRSTENTKKRIPTRQARNTRLHASIINDDHVNRRNDGLGSTALHWLVHADGGRYGVGDGDGGCRRMDVTGASARPPRPDIEIVHRRAAEDDTEGISISLGTVPSVEAFVRAFETAGLWMQAL
jgi:hypothetical protein